MIEKYFENQQPILVTDEMISPNFSSWKKQIETMNNSIGINNKNFKFKEKYETYLSKSKFNTLSNTERKIGEKLYICFIANVVEENLVLELLTINETEFQFLEENYILASLQQFAKNSIKLPIFIKREKNLKELLKTVYNN